MCRFIAFIFLNFLPFLYGFSQDTLVNKAFTEGESLKYKVSYHSFLGDFDAGKAEIEIHKSAFEEKEVFHIIGFGETNNFFDVFYRVRDQFESKIDTSTLLPYYFSRRTREGNYKNDDDVIFDRLKGKAISRRKEVAISSDVHDIISAVFYLRTLSVADFGMDSTLRINFYLDDSVYNSVIIYEGQSVVETKWGWIKCLKVKPMLVEGEVFSDKYPMSVWVTDDLNHIPVLAESEIIVGSVRMELFSYEGLLNPFIKPLSRKELKRYKAL